MNRRKPKTATATKTAFDAAMDRICAPEIQDAYNGREGWRGEPAHLFDLLVKAEVLGLCAKTDEEKRASAEEARQLHDQIRQAAIAVALWGSSGVRPSWASKRHPAGEEDAVESALGQDPIGTRVSALGKGPKS